MRPKITAHLIYLPSGQEGISTDYITPRSQSETGNKTAVVNKLVVGEIMW